MVDLDDVKNVGERTLNSLDSVSK